MGSLAELTAKFQSVWPLLDERTRRLMAASEAMALGYGGVSLVHRACGLSRLAIAKGIRDMARARLGGRALDAPGGPDVGGLRVDRPQAAAPKTSERPDFRP